MAAVEMAWHEVMEHFDVSRKNDMCTELSRDTLNTLRVGDRGVRALNHLQKHLDKLMRTDMGPQFCRALVDNDVQPHHRRVHTAVQVLHERLKNEILPFARRLQKLKETLQVVEWKRFGESNAVDLALLMLRATVFAQLNHTEANKTIYCFYERALRCHAFREEQKRADFVPSDVSNDQQCRGCGHQALFSSDSGGCECNSIINSFHETTTKLSELSLLHRLTPNILMTLAKESLGSRVQEMCQGNFTNGYLSMLYEWIDSVLLTFIERMYNLRPGKVNDEERSVLQSWRRELHEHLVVVYIRLRTNELFNVIIEFPESAPVLEDLKECLAKSEQRLMLSTHLRDTLEARILHIGVNTADILTAYIAAIKALRLLDPSGLVLNFACEPVRKYLRTREDTIRCIVQGLIDDTTSELAEELQRNEGIRLEDSSFCSETEDDEDESEADQSNGRLHKWQRWQPAPMENGLPHKPQRSHSDIISMLVNIYGSKELFVNEYRTLLSTRLLSFNNNSNNDGSTESEIRNLELLKRRFGESLLHSCEVMLKDITDSKRINCLLNENDDKENDEDNRTTSREESENVENEELNTRPVDLSKLPFPVSATILSAQFWPDFKQETLQLPPVVSDSLDTYRKAYEANKGNRTLIWKPHLGHAIIDLEMDGWSEPLRLHVTPMQASIIYHFQERSRWNAEELSSVLKIALPTLRRRIAFWQSHGIIKEVDTDTYELSSSETGTGSSVGVAPVTAMSHDEDELASATSSRHEQRHAEFQLFWTFIVSMLTNLEDELSLDQIYQKLKCFAFAQTSTSAAPTSSSMAGRTAEERDRAELAAFLDSKVRQRELTFTAGVYKLPK